MFDDRIFRLFACCRPVRGAARSIICDLQRQAYYPIPNALYEMLIDCGDQTVAQIKGEYGLEYSSTIDEYYNFLIKNELGFWCDDPSEFPDIQLDWEAPSEITNTIIDIDSYSAHDFAKIYDQLDELGCIAVQVRFYCERDMTSIEQEVLLPAADRRLRSIELMLKYSRGLTSQLAGVLERHQRITSVMVHSAPDEGMVNIHGVRVAFRTEVIDSDRHCGQVHPAYLTPTLDLFCESLEFNNCLNRKLGIDTQGELKNCPSSPKTFGNIQDNSIVSVIGRGAYREAWRITKDQVEVCKDCEFRYICVDCRVFVSSENPLSKPSKCSYDPYTARWS